MSVIAQIKDDRNPDGGGTKINRFLANRGVIIIKEIREIGSMKCDYGVKLKAETVILATAKSSTKVSQKSFGIRLESIFSEDDEFAAYLDYDETEEFSNAITFVFEAAQRIACEKRDYTEAVFSTKDDISVGFYQDLDQDQKAFLRLGSGSRSIFMSVPFLLSVKKLVDAARAHLIKKGAGTEQN
jgi:hypothetical protein